MSDDPHSHLPRLDPVFYHGYAIVHWVFTVDQRAIGWLDDLTHARIRELLLHMSGKYDLMCPTYCLMPDHMHIFLMGVSISSDQQKAVQFLRRHLNILFGVTGNCLQKQAYDHVLQEYEREQGVFEKIAWYVFENPVRAGLVHNREDWKYSGCMVSGHPGWSVFHQEYWPSLWNEYRVIRQKKSHGLSPAATN